jgi:hypothetical protein
VGARVVGMWIALFYQRNIKNCMRCPKSSLDNFHLSIIFLFIHVMALDPKFLFLFADGELGVVELLVAMVLVHRQIVLRRPCFENAIYNYSSNNRPLFHS